MGERLRRAVVVHRPTDYELLVATHATRGQAEFFLRSRGQDLADIESRHQLLQRALAGVMGHIPARWRRTSVSRDELNRFLFEPDDVVVAVGQDGLVANVAKYLRGQLVVGVNPLPQAIDGLLVRHSVSQVRDVLGEIDSAARISVEERTMVQATLDDGQVLVALNEIFVGHRTHQSARYRLDSGQTTERQSSSGLICCTGTGSTGWAKSISLATQSVDPLPAPSEPTVCFFVREAWPSSWSGHSLIRGSLNAGATLKVTSEMNAGGVVFGDGIEDDFLSFDWGRVASLGVAEQRLKLVNCG